MLNLARPGSRRPLAVATLALVSVSLLAACGSSAASAVPVDAAGQPTSAPATVAPAASADTGETGGATGSVGLASLVPADQVQAALGEVPTPACDTSSLTASVSCVWKAADGSWLKVEDGSPQEMPDLASFTERVTGTLGLDEPVEGLGEAAFLGNSARGTRIAVFLGEGRTVWVVLNKAGDAAMQAPLVTGIAERLVAGG